MTIDGFFKKAIGKVHKPTAISSLEDDVLELSAEIEYYERHLTQLKIQKAQLQQKIRMMRDE